MLACKKIRNRRSFISFGWTQHQLACYNIRSILFPTQLSSVWTWPLAKCVVTIFVALQKHTQRWPVSGLDFSGDEWYIPNRIWAIFQFPQFHLSGSETVSFGPQCPPLWAPTPYVSQVWLSCHPHFSRHQGCPDYRWPEQQKANSGEYILTTATIA